MLKTDEFSEDKNANDWGEVFLNGKRASLCFARVSAIPYNMAWQGKQRDLNDTEEAPFLSFSSDGEVTVSVRSERIKPHSEIVIRPQSKGVRAIPDGEGVRFTLKKHGAYTFEVDGFHNALHLFFNPERDFASEEPLGNGRKILRYASGTHQIGNVELGSDTTVILDSGAVVYGSFTAINAENIRVCGYGIIDGSKEIRRDDTLMFPISIDPSKGFPLAEREYTDEDLTNEGVLRQKLTETKPIHGCIRFYNCKNFSVEGVILRDSASFGLIAAACENFVIDNVKTIGMWRYNSDGIDLFNSRDAVVRNAFLRNFDDCMVIKGIVGWDKRINENILVENCVVWCDWGSALEIGAETNADSYRHITFRNCDVIHASGVVMRIHHHNRAKISDVVYENINGEFTKHQLRPEIIKEGETYQRTPNIYQPHLIELRIINDGWFNNKKDPGTIDGVVVKNTKVFKDDEVGIPQSEIYGCDEEHQVKNVLIETVSVNGEKIADYDRYFTGMQYTGNVKYVE